MIYTTDILGDQWEIFFGSLMLGVLLGGCYDVFRIIRIVFSVRQKMTIAMDVVYCLWAGFLVFSFLLEENFGIPRLYIYIGAAAGFFIWYFMVGKLTIRAAKLLRKILNKIKKTVFVPLLKISKKVLGFCKKKVKSFENILAKKLSTSKKLLKKESSRVYNKLYLNKKKAFPFCGGKAGKEPRNFESKGTEEKKESFAQDRSYCLRSISPVFTGGDSGEHSQKERGT